MPIKRRISRNRDYPLTRETIKAFRAGDRATLAQLWNLKPWQPSPIDVGGKCPWRAGTAAARWWPRAQELRADFEAAPCQ